MLVGVVQKKPKNCTSVNKCFTVTKSKIQVKKTFKVLHTSPLVTETIAAVD